MNTFTDGTDEYPLPRAIHVTEVIRSAESELVALLRQQDELTKRIESFKQTLEGLARIYGGSALSRHIVALLESEPPAQAVRSRRRSSDESCVTQIALATENSCK